MSEAPKRENRRKFLQGTVLSDKMNKTRVVQVHWSAKHPKYLKILRRASKYKAHDEEHTLMSGQLSDHGDRLEVIEQ